MKDLQEPRVLGWEVSKLYFWEFGVNGLRRSPLRRGEIPGGLDGLGSIGNCIFYCILMHMGMGSGFWIGSWGVRAEVGCRNPKWFCVTTFLLTTSVPLR